MKAILLPSFENMITLCCGKSPRTDHINKEFEVVGECPDHTVFCSGCGELYQLEDAVRLLCTCERHKAYPGFAVARKYVEILDAPSGQRREGG